VAFAVSIFLFLRWLLVNLMKSQVISRKRFKISDLPTAGRFKIQDLRFKVLSGSREKEILKNVSLASPFTPAYRQAGPHEGDSKLCFLKFLLRREEI
jgi:hypothetical protein